MKSRKAVPLLNLDEDYDEDNDNADDQDEEMLERERRHLAALDKKLSTCQRCGPDRFCKIDQSGGHVNLTMGQRNAWANALVRLFSMSPIVEFHDRH